MTLPQKKSRNIEIDGVKYRWLISKKNDTISLSIETQENAKQLLQAFFEPHDSYKRDSNNKWKKVEQGVSITPKLVEKVIKHGLTNGWNPNQKSKKEFYFHTWETDKMISQIPILDSDEIRLRDIVIEQVSDLRFDFSLDPEWRKKIFNAEIGRQFILPSKYLGLSREVQDLGLKFAVCNYGWTDYGFIIFAIASVEFPDIEMFTVNNPEII